MNDGFYEYLVMSSFLTLEKQRKNGKSYTIEEIELYTKENPNKHFIGDLVAATNGGYLVYMGDKWMDLEEFIKK
jgi:hypothetical protein